MRVESDNFWKLLEGEKEGASRAEAGILRNFKKSLSRTISSELLLHKKRNGSDFENLLFLFAIYFAEAFV